MSQSFQKTSVEKKPQARSLQTLQVYYMLKQRGHDVFTKSPRHFNMEHIQRIYRAETIIKRQN